MRAGRLDRTITIQRLGETVDAAGTVSRAWVDLAMLRVEVVSLNLAEAAAAFGDAETGALTLHSRFVVGITTADRVLLDGTPHNLKAIAEIGRRRGLELRLERTP
jgi:head-tail adaptor